MINDPAPGAGGRLRVRRERTLKEGGAAAVAGHAELKSLYGEDGVVLLDEAALRARAVPEEDVAQLARTGLPALVDVLFTVRVRGEPEAFGLLPVETGGRTVDVLVLGGPTDDPALRFFLDLERRYVVLLALGPEGARAEIVNTTLADFTEFLYRVSLHRREAAAGLPPGERGGRARDLRARLARRDPAALAAPDSWWSMVLDALEGAPRPEIR